MAKKSQGWGPPRVTWGWIPLALLAAVILTVLFAVL